MGVSGGRSCTRGLAVGIRVLEYEYRCRMSCGVGWRWVEIGGV